MLLLKACPHCRGDLVVEQDTGSGYLECVQCGHVLSRAQEHALGVRIARGGALVHEAARRSPAPRSTRRARTRAAAVTKQPELAGV